MKTLLLFLLPLPLLAGPPNVVMIIGDDQHHGDYGFRGHPHIKTPNIDALAKESFVFERGYVPTSLCRASLASMVTGLYPHQHRVTSNDPPMPKGKSAGQMVKDEKYLADRTAMVEIFEQSPNLAKLLTKAGYRTFQSGKWWEGNACRCGGFTEGMTVGDWTKGGRHGDEGLKIGREGLDKLDTFLSGCKTDNAPFFVWYAPMMPHQPHNPPERLLAKYRDKTPSLNVAKYWAMCEWFDETVGDVLVKLKANGQAENTLVVYLHDNGWIQEPDKPTFAAKSKKSQYDGGLRTPILLRQPGTIAPGKSDALVSSVDIAPTILAVCGVKADMPGIDLRDAAALAKRNQVVGAIFEHTAIDIEKPAANLTHRWIVHGWDKLIVAKDGSTELFDVKADPTEEKPLKDDAKVKELKTKLDAWWTGK